uniref:citramalate synthase n=1 Tax=Caldinitratiruptor microaerophilus TaxID=671077 RepID=UPI003872D257
MQPSVVLYDTTLRDGSQRAGISFTVADKVRIARRLDEFGMHYVEGGWPGSNPKDAEFFRLMQDEPLRRARLVAFSSTRRPGVRCEDDIILRQLLDAGTQATCIVGKSWDFHVTGALGTTLEENLAMIGETVAFLRARGREVIYDAEHFFDGFKANPEYALATLRAAADAGADWVVLCDTNGGTLPHEVEDIVAMVREALPGVRLGIHTHDDSGVAVANTLAAVRAGCTMVQGTVNGYGERCGNANLCAVIPNLQLKLGYACVEPEALKGLTALAGFVSEAANLPPWDAQPYVGRNAFTHKAGIHVSALLKSTAMYEHVPPESVGNERRVLVSELSGRSNLQYAFGGDSLDPEQSKALLDRIKALEHEGYQFEGAEASLELLLRDEGQPRPFELESFRVIIERRGGEVPRAEASIKVRVGDRTVHTAAEGNGPVNALDVALRKALSEIYPSLSRVRLTDYKVRVLEGSEGTGARVRVLVESTDGSRRWGTVGVSTNVIEASWQALADSLEWHLLREARDTARGATATAGDASRAAAG